MKTTLTSLILLSIFCLNSIAEDTSRWGLPEGAKARLGRGTIFELKYSPDGTRLAAASSTGVWLYDSATGAPVVLMRNEDSSRVSQVAFTSDGQSLAAASGDRIFIWDAVTGEQKHSLQLSKHYARLWFRYVAFSPDGRTLASGVDNVVRLRDAVTGEIKHTWTGERFGQVMSLAFSADGRTLASGHESPSAGHTSDGRIRLWDAATGELKEILDLGQTEPTELVYSPDGRTLAVANRYWSYAYGSWGFATIRDAATGKLKHELIGHAGFVSSLAYSADGRLLATGSWIDEDGRRKGHAAVQLWDTDSGARLRSLDAYAWEVGSLALSPDGNTLASLSSGEIRLWDAEIWTLKRTLTVSSGDKSLYSVAFSPDGGALAGGGRSTIHLWDTESGVQKPSLDIIEGGVTSVSYSPDGYTLAGGSTDNTVRVWDAATGENIRTLEGHTGDVTSVAFSPDGRTLASGSNDGTVLLWEIIPSPAPLEDKHPQVVEPPPIKPDVNGDGGVDVQDLVLVAARLGISAENRTDVNGDGTVNVLDLVLVAGMADDLTDALSMSSTGTMVLRTTNVKEWLEEARQLILADAAIPRGIQYLENLLEALTPERTALLPNYPNPFNPETWIPYQLARDSVPQISIYSAKGILVRQLDLGLQPEGYYTDKHYAAYWDGRNDGGELLASGVYVYVFRAGSYRASRRMAIVR